MKHMVFVLIGLAFVAGCGNESSISVQAATPGSAGTGAFSARLGDQDYAVDVNCSYFETDSFMFRSLPGAEVLVEGMQDPRGKFILSITEQGQLYSTGRLESFEKGSNGAEGSGTLYPDGGGESREVTFTVACSS